MTIKPELQGSTLEFLGVARDSYGDQYCAHNLEIYKLYVEMADRIGARRDRANTFFAATNAALLALLWRFLATNDTPPNLEAVLVPLSGVLLCVFWSRVISSYRQLSSGKFKVIHEIEKSLSLDPFRAEWDVLGKGTNPVIYRPLTGTEVWVPRIFAALYVLLIAFIAVRIFTA